MNCSDCNLYSPASRFSKSTEPSSIRKFRSPSADDIDIPPGTGLLKATSPI